jgi:hypothetical protein
MRYWQSYRFVFNNPNWLTNLVLVAVCSIIPILGQIVLIGYCFEIIDVLHRRRQRERIGALQIGADPKDERILDALPVDEDYDLGSYHDFDFNRFAEYLTRGIWPFLVQMIVHFAIGMIAGLFMFVGMMLAFSAVAATNSPILIFALYPLFLIVYAFLMMVAGILMTPLYLRAGLSGDFASAFSMEFYRDFMKRVGKEVVLAELFLLATGSVVSIVGLLLCYVGIFPAIALLLYVHHHLEYQLYELYLERGGVPVERKEKSPFVVEEYPDEEISTSHVMKPQSEERFTDFRGSRDDHRSD